jgi:hypothetical protein
MGIDLVQAVRGGDPSNQDMATIRRKWAISGFYVRCNSREGIIFTFGLKILWEQALFSFIILLCS